MDDSIFYTIVVALITIGVVIAIWGWDYVCITQWKN
jgi:preprotein translocase subunit SecE